MLKVFGLTAITVLLLGSISCTQQSQKANDNTTVATATATPTREAAASTPTPAATAPLTAAVKVANFKFTDDVSGTPVTTIKVGGTVTWTLAPGPPHSLERVAKSADNGCEELDAASFNSALTPGQPVSRTFTKIGTFGYHCGIHKGNPNCKTPPGDGSMPGVIKVVP